MRGGAWSTCAAACSVLDVWSVSGCGVGSESNNRICQDVNGLNTRAAKHSLELLIASRRCIHTLDDTVKYRFVRRRHYTGDDCGGLLP